MQYKCDALPFLPFRECAAAAAAESIGGRTRSPSPREIGVLVRVLSETKASLVRLKSRFRSQ